MAEWSAEQVLAWCASQLPARVAGAAAHSLEDGEELEVMSACSLLKRLKRQGATEAEAQALLACRDAVLAEQRRPGDEGEGGEGKGEQAPATATAAAAAAAAADAAVDPCEICFEPFDRGERVPRLLKECGHTFCAPRPRSLRRGVAPALFCAG